MRASKLGQLKLHNTRGLKEAYLALFGPRGFLAEGVIALFVMCIGILCNGRVLNRMALIRILAGLSGYCGASGVISRSLGNP